MKNDLLNDFIENRYIKDVLSSCNPEAGDNVVHEIQFNEAQSNFFSFGFTHQHKVLLLNGAWEFYKSQQKDNKQ